MKPCSHNREDLTWLALDTLGIRKVEELRAHLETCEGCRQYLAEISSVVNKLAASESNPDLQTSESFHRKLVARLRAEKPESVWETARVFFRSGLLHWRVASPVAATVVLLIFALVAQRPRTGADNPLPVQSTAKVATAPSLDADLPPTIANYQMAANQSLEKLDALLTEQGRMALPPAPIYTAAMLTLANTPR